MKLDEYRGLAIKLAGAGYCPDSQRVILVLIWNGLGGASGLGCAPA
jgi:hypothetical protein